MLDPAGVVPYLMERELVTPPAVVDGGLRVVDVSRRNRVFAVMTQSERSFVLKCAAEGDTGVAHEAAVLARLHSMDGRPLGACLPALVAYDAATGVLILEAAPNAQDLVSRHARGRFSRALAGEAGRALAAVHSLAPEALEGIPTHPDPTWTLRVHRPSLRVLRTLSAAGVEVVRAVQGSDTLCAELDALLAGWCTESVIHGDVRWDNCLAVPGRGTMRWNRLLLIDWELAAAGDPALDVGAFFGEYLRAWLESIPIADPQDPGRLLAHARFPLHRMQPALRSFWDAYDRHRGQSAAESSRTLRRATQFAAVRILEGALEEAQALTQLSAPVRYALALAHNVLRRPDEAAAQLLGFAAIWGRT